MPWVLNDKYVSGRPASHLKQRRTLTDLAPKPQPLNNLCVFRYERVWHSLAGKDVATEMNKAFSQARLVQLRNPQLTKEQQKELHDQLWREGKHELHKAALTDTDGPILTKIFPAVSLPLSFGRKIGKLTLPQSSLVDASQVKPTDELPGLLGILQVDELRRMITGKLCPSIGDITALASTCKRAAICLEDSFVSLLPLMIQETNLAHNADKSGQERWDFNSGVFSAEEFSDKRDASGRLVQGGGKRTNILIISPISTESPEKPYTADFTNLVRLCRCFYALKPPEARC